MAYIKAQYPQFKDIKVWHTDGFDVHKLVGEMAAWMRDPAHAKYRYINSEIHFMDACSVAGLGRIHTDQPADNYWVEIIIIYTE